MSTMPRIPLSNIEGNVYERLMGHRPEILKAWFNLDTTMRFSGALGSELKEEVRRSLAPGVGCVFCASLGDEAALHADRKEALAVGFAQMVLEDWRSIDESAFDRLKNDFTSEEIVELVAWIAFMIAAQMFGAILKTTPATEDELAAYNAWRKQGAAALAG
jgi:alkylhydroperoxidase family enzyme